MMADTLGQREGIMLLSFLFVNVLGKEDNNQNINVGKTDKMLYCHVGKTDELLNKEDVSLGREVYPVIRRKIEKRAAALP